MKMRCVSASLCEYSCALVLVCVSITLWFLKRKNVWTNVKMRCVSTSLCEYYLVVLEEEERLDECEDEVR